MNKFTAGAVVGALGWWLLPTIVALPLLVVSVVALVADGKKGE